MGSSTYDYPPLANWQDFEKLAVSLFTAIKKTPFQRLGREGQAQNGVDAYAMMPDNTVIVLQCKGKDQKLGKKLTNKDIEDTLERIRDFNFKISEVYILTTAPDDKNLQLYALALSAQRREQGKCPIHIWGWGKICEEINQHPEVQKANFGHFYEKPSILHWIFISVIVALLATTAYLFTNNIMFNREINFNQKEKSVINLQTYADLLNELNERHMKCQKFLEGRIFYFHAEFRESCSQPIEAQLKVIESHIQKITPSLAAEVLAEIKKISQLMNNDYKEAEVAAYMTKSFEDEYVRAMHDLCRKEGGDEYRKHLWNAVRNKQSTAINFQIYYYFMLRDFIIPGIDSIVSRALMRSRELNGQSIPDDLIMEANKFMELMKMRSEYIFSQREKPFLLSKMKYMSSRNINILTGNSDIEIEEMHRIDVLDIAPNKIFYGRIKDIEILINCNIFRPEAKELADKL
jgi:hypothetical protein